MHDLINLLSFAFALGLTASLSPGAFTMLLISQTLRYGVKEGIKVSFAPLITDLPIILVSTFILSQFVNFKSVLGLISIFGSIFLAYLAYGNIKLREINTSDNKDKPGSLKKGIITNLLTPAPYMFWFTIGSPTVLKAAQVNIVLPFIFIVTLYVTFITGYIMIALLVSKSKTLLKSKWYLYVLKGLGIILLIFSLILLKNGMQLLGII